MKEQINKNKAPTEKSLKVPKTPKTVNKAGVKKSKKAKKTKKVKKPSMASLRKKAMKLWTEKVKNAQGRVCAICGLVDGTPNGKISKKTGKEGASYINSHHIEDRSNYALRWDFLNGIALCPSHHEFGKDSAHRSPVWMMDWLMENRPQIIDYIRENRGSKPQTSDEYSRDDLMRIIEELEQEVKEEEMKMLNIKLTNSQC